jgi:hypothetical protein
MAVYVPAATKAQYVLLAAQRGQSLAACLTDAAAVLTKHSGASKTFLMSDQQLRRLVAEVVAGTTVVPIQERTEAPPEDLKRCKHGHLYPATKRACPLCAKARKRRQRARSNPQPMS